MFQLVPFNSVAGPRDAGSVLFRNFTRQFIPSQETVVSLEESACCSEHDVLEHDVSDDESTLSSEKARAKLDFSPEQLRNPFIRFKKG